LQQNLAGRPQLQPQALLPTSSQDHLVAPPAPQPPTGAAAPSGSAAPTANLTQELVAQVEKLAMKQVKAEAQAEYHCVFGQTQSEPQAWSAHTAKYKALTERSAWKQRCLSIQAELQYTPH
jgi:hypothetical protein